MAGRKAQAFVLLLLLLPLTLVVLVTVGGLMIILFGQGLCALLGGVFCR